jgi:hypothetical protein
MLDDVEATSKTITDAKKARIEAEDPLTKMKRDLDALETQNKFNDERKKLKGSDANSTGNDKP